MSDAIALRSVRRVEIPGGHDPDRLVPDRPPRDTRMDIVRGWLQLTIFASHAMGSWIGGWMIHAAWGLSDSSEQFVFLSGFTLGSLFARRSAREGWRGGAADMLRRAAKLYRTYLITFVLFFAMVLAAGWVFPGEARRLGWGFLMDDPLRAIPAALIMLYQPDFMGILPMFVWCMMVLPAFAWLEAKFGDWALAAPIAIYGLSWLAGLWPPSLGPETGIAFNPFAWQLPFMLGAWLGRRALLDGRALPSSRVLVAAAAVMLAVGLALRLGWYGFVPWMPPIDETSLVVGKEGLALPRLLHGLALALLVAVSVPRDAGWMHGALGRWMAAIGRHSLQVFCVGLFLSWAAASVFRAWPDWPWWLDPVVIGVGCAALGFVARRLDHRRAGQRPVAPA